MIEDVVAPTWGLTTDEFILLEWLCSVGDEVTKEQPLVELEADKADGELPSPVDGVVEELLAEEGDTVVPGQVILRIRRS